MRQSTFTETQIVSILKEADAGRLVNEIWRQDGISSATYDTWKAEFRRPRRLRCEAAEGTEHENSRLKRMDADLSLENAALTEVIAKKL